MDYTNEFEAMRPYNDSEVKDAISRIIDEKQFIHIISKIFTNKDPKEIIHGLKKINTVNDFQAIFSQPVVRGLLKLTAGDLTFSGSENIDVSKPYLFIANHRDIVLDSAILQLFLYEKGHNTSQITVGSNLMFNDFVVDLGKLNKMFIFSRGEKMQMVKNAIIHSGYIKHVLTKKRESVWIAQRDGRTKDGNDMTQVGLIKMLLIGSGDPIPALKELNIVPVTISYEYEPCDALKVQELYKSKLGEYVKQPGEDYNSVLSGIRDYKGRIHLKMGKPLNSMLDNLKEIESDLNALLAGVRHEINTQIHRDFELWPNNYIAFDILNESNTYSGSKYSQEQKTLFLDYVSRKVNDLEGERVELTKMFMSMYAMPVFNKMEDNKTT